MPIETVFDCEQTERLICPKKDRINIDFDRVLNRELTSDVLEGEYGIDCTEWASFQFTTHIGSLHSIKLEGGERSCIPGTSLRDFYDVLISRDGIVLIENEVGTLTDIRTGAKQYFLQSQNRYKKLYVNCQISRDSISLIEKVVLELVSGYTDAVDQIQTELKLPIVCESSTLQLAKIREKYPFRLAFALPVKIPPPSLPVLSD